MVGCSPQTGHFGSFLSLNSRNFIFHASNRSSLFTKISSPPKITLIVPSAWIAPTIPGNTPSTPPSAQDGTRPGGGGSGYKQRNTRHAPPRRHSPALQNEKSIRRC